MIGLWLSQHHQQANIIKAQTDAEEAKGVKVATSSANELIDNADEITCAEEMLKATESSFKAAEANFTAQKANLLRLQKKRATLLVEQTKRVRLIEPLLPKSKALLGDGTA
jgi:hypothetical protein